MPAIEYLESHVVYENPRPHVHSRHGYFPGLALLPSGELIALFVIAEAFEAPNGTTWVARSRDDGRTWTLQGPLYHKAVVGFETTDSLKPTLLRDGSLIATGYRFHRHDPEMPIAIPETGGILPGDDIVSFSSDEGRTWTVPAIIARSHPELLEISGPCIESRRSGDLLAVAAPYRMPDGSNPSGQIGVLVRSRDKGRTWDDTARYFTTPGNRITPFEGRICEMQEGRLVALVWAYDAAADAHLANHVAVSHDDGRTWSSPAPTPHHGQASNLLWLGEDLLLTIHAHRGGRDTGVYVRLVDFRGDAWKPLAETVIFGAGAPGQTREGQQMAEMFRSLRFGQPSLLKLASGGILASHWAVEDGQGRIRTHRLRVRL
ncbi:MAG TPA: sialidase family protein [Bryobacteraceae bacterium]|nr:sialidase family protein [Bryobacteraceae bacterium]